MFYTIENVKPNKMVIFFSASQGKRKENCIYNRSSRFVRGGNIHINRKSTVKKAARNSVEKKFGLKNHCTFKIYYIHICREMG